MPVNPSEQALFQELTKRNESVSHQSEHKMTLAEFRAMSDMFLEFTGPAAPIPFNDMTVPTRDGYQIPIRIYNPEQDKTKPIFIMYPGCGYVLDLFEVNAIAASRIAHYADCKVILVNFRLCPEVSMPTPIHDAFDATKYIAQHAEIFNIDPDNIIIGGFSSGAHAAANVSSLLRFDNEVRIKHQILLNGSYDLTYSNHDYDAFEVEDKICQRGEVIDFLFAQYGLAPEQFNQPPFSPLFEKDVSGLPDTTFLIAEYDGVRNDSEAYYQHLISQNDNIERIVLPGQTHNTIIMRGAMSDGEDPAKVIADIIKR